MIQMLYQELSKLVPDVNRDAMGILYIVEVCLRELIVSELSAIKGPRWYKSALPGSQIMDAYLSAREYESHTPWQSLVPLHPIYYLDFPDLATIIERTDNWNSCFKRIFARKDVFIPSLRALEPIRNAVAHNRKLSDTSLSHLETFLGELTNVVSDARVKELVTSCTEALEVGHALVVMKKELETCVEAAEDLPTCDVWLKAKDSWWFDSDYLGADITPVEQFFDNLLPEYESIPKGWGSGPRIEESLQAHSFSGVADKASNVLTNLINSWSKNDPRD
jgi:hypothetical protein